MAILTAFKEGTADNMQLDAGIILYDVNPTTDGLESGNFNIDTLAKTKCIGATKGGAQFSAVPEIRSLLDGINGSRGNYDGANIIDSWEITLKTTMSELTLDNFKRITGSTQTASHSKFDAVTSKVGLIPKAAYKNVAWFGTVAGKKDPIVILLKQAFSVNGINVVAEDKNSGTVEVEFKAHFTLGSDAVPYTIYYPKA